MPEMKGVTVKIPTDLHAEVNSLTLEPTRAVLDAVDPLKPVPQDGEDLPVSEEESPRRYPSPLPGDASGERAFLRYCRGVVPSCC